MAEQGHSDGPPRTRTGRIRKAKKGLRVHTCDVCGKTYTRNEHLRRHRQLHAGDADPQSQWAQEMYTAEEGEGPPIDDDEFFLDVVPRNPAPSSPRDHDATNTSLWDEFPDFLDDFGEHDETQLAQLLGETSTDPLSLEDVEALGKTFQDRLRNDFHYRRFTRKSPPNAGPVPVDRLSLLWTKMTNMLSTVQQRQRRRQRSEAYRVTFYSTSRRQYAHVYQDTYWTQMHPHLRVFEALSSFKRSMASRCPSLMLIVIALGAAITPTRDDQERGHIFAEDALVSLSSETNLSDEPASLDQQRAAVLLDVYLTFFSRVPTIELPRCIPPSTNASFQPLHNHLRYLRKTLHLPPMPTTTNPTILLASRLPTLLGELVNTIPLRPLLIVAGQSFLNGEKVSASAHTAAQRSLRQWTHDLAKTSRARSLSSDILDLGCRQELGGCPWRERGLFIACLASWAARYAEGDVGVALVEAREVLELGRSGGWMGTEIADTLGELEERGGEEGWF